METQTSVTNPNSVEYTEKLQRALDGFSSVAPEIAGMPYDPVIFDEDVRNFANVYFSRLGSAGLEDRMDSLVGTYYDVLSQEDMARLTVEFRFSRKHYDTQLVLFLDKSTGVLEQFHNEYRHTSENPHDLAVLLVPDNKRHGLAALNRIVLDLHTVKQNKANKMTTSLDDHVVSALGMIAR